jgi:rhamnulokinase
MPTYLAFDLGASSGRAVLGTLDGDVMRMDEVHRFETPLREAGGHLTWDVAELEAAVRAGLRRARTAAPDLRSVSVDSWAVDYVPLGADGGPLRPPFAYRDARTDGMMERAFERMPREELYRLTGIQFLPFNTLYQVLADPPEERMRTATRLFIADYLNHRLGGRDVVDVSMASTTAALDARTRRWSDEILGAVGLEATGWPEIVPCGTVTGALADDPGVAVVASCSHDTAAAVAAVPAVPGTRWAYLSCGTWSLLGAELAAPLLTDAACEASFTHEAGLDGTIRFLKNITGLWLLTELERGWNAAGTHPGLVRLLREAEASRYAVLLDPDDPAFAAPGGMEARVRAWIAGHALPAPETRGDLVRCMLRSLAATHAARLRTLEALTGDAVDVLHVVGGGSKNALLCRWTADACGVPVVAGPAEATALGNLLVQARTMGDLPPGVTIRDVARRSADLRRYEPEAF